MINKAITQQAKIFLYDLKNARHEYSFNATDSWVCSRSTLKEKRVLESQFYPLLFTECAAADLADLAGLVSAGLDDQLISTSSVKDETYLVAYCKTKEIR